MRPDRGFIFSIALFSMSAISPALADYQAGVEAYKVKNFKAAMTEWKPLAEAGDAEAQNAVGALYDHGLGVPEDDIVAVSWYRLAAEQGFALAMRNLGEKYLAGHGVAYDPVLAESWLKKAADLGDFAAANRLSSIGKVKSPARPIEAAPSDAITESTVTPPPPSDESADPSVVTANATTSFANSTTAPSANTSSESAWLLGQWRGPSSSCPPESGIEFALNRSLSYFEGKISSELRATYKTFGDSIVEISVAGIDGIWQTYRYQKIDDRHIEIASIPESMPQSMLGAVFERCGEPIQLTPNTAATPLAPSSSTPPTIQEVSAPPVVIVDATPTSTNQSASSAPQAAPAPQVSATSPTSPTNPSPANSSANDNNALQAGLREFGRGNSQAAITHWQPGAESGNILMQLLIGSLYDYGQGIEQNDEEAIKWYQMAANQGSARGKFLIGTIYARSQKSENLVKGLAWMKAAARTLEKNGQAADGAIDVNQISVLAQELMQKMSEEEKTEADQLAAGL